ncbi:MAG: RNA 2',3'-cyclic phosphodiesterase [Sinimarinibacterium sp.]
MQTNRLFLALVPDDGVRQACNSAARNLVIRLAPPQKRVVQPENYHITLEFLGDTVTAEQEAEVRRAAGRVCGSPFSLKLDVASAFAAANVWWIGPRETPAELTTFRAELHKQVSGIGLHLERSRFTPHLTVLKTAAKLAPLSIAPIEWRVSGFALMRSTLSGEGSTYEILQRWPLQIHQRGAQQDDAQLVLL